MSGSFLLCSLSEQLLRRLAEEVAFVVRRGDCIALKGDLGAGKTTFARALITALMAGEPQEIPSPTFTLVQTYDTPRLTVAHFDLYRLGDASELAELGLDHALQQGIAVIEWPERAGEALPDSRLQIALEEAAPAPGGTMRNPDLRSAMLTGYGDWAPRLERLHAVHRLIAEAGFTAGDDTLSYLQGDASVRRYGRLTRRGAAGALLMDWARQPDGPPIRDGKPYSRIAHLAEDVRPFVAIADALRQAGLSAPQILAHDLDQGVLLLEDFGDRVFGREIATGANQAELWQAATDTLVSLRHVRAGCALPLPDGSHYTLPACDRGVLQIETELLLDWYWPALWGSSAPADIRAEFTGLWTTILDQILAQPKGWLLRDYHSPNLIWLPERSGVRRVGIIDFQDALLGPAAYDLVSLLQDARVDVPPTLEAQLLDHYCARVQEEEAGFQRDAFIFAYAALGAQRNTKILGIFARLARRDGKPQYLAHIPRIWRHLARNLDHPQLEALRSWYNRHLPVEARSSTLTS